jgi:hypothetical protein
MMNFKLTAAAILVSCPAFAQDLANADAITAAISGNTVQGSMVSSGVYTEFYGSDGVIKGKDYAGKWSIEGDTMCFSYGEAATCYGVRISGDQVTWVIDGKDDGTGTIVAGNPNGF